MFSHVITDFAAALGHLNDLEFFAALGMVTFGVLAVTTLSLLRKQAQMVRDSVARREVAA